MKRTLVLLTLVFSVLAVCGCGHKPAPATPLSLENNSTQRVNLLSAPKDKDTETLPSVGSDAASQPIEALSSDNPNERLQVVRQAQDKWGSHKVAQGIDQFAIVGRWNHPWGNAAYFTFNADGTFKNVSLLKDTEGTYRFLSHSVIEFSYPGILYGENTAQLEYRVLGDTLELHHLGGWVQYRRATR